VKVRNAKKPDPTLEARQPEHATDVTTSVKASGDDSGEILPIDTAV
jgi:hypothetical protein